MEIVCQRCHRTVAPETSFCAGCGLPQLTYESASAPGQLDSGSWPQPPLDASSVEWKHVLRIAAMVAIPGGVLANTPGFLGAFLMPFLAASVVLLYMRHRQPAWLTIGAGARIGLVTGLFSAWISVATAGLSLVVLRYWLHQGSMIDDYWMMIAGQQVPQQMAASGWDQQMIALQRAKMLSPDGQAGWLVGALVLLASILTGLSVAGGAVGARILVRARRSQL